MSVSILFHLLCSFISWFHLQRVVIISLFQCICPYPFVLSDPLTAALFLFNTLMAFIYFICFCGSLIFAPRGGAIVCLFILWKQVLLSNSIQYFFMGDPQILKHKHTTRCNVPASIAIIIIKHLIKKLIDGNWNFWLKFYYPKYCTFSYEIISQA